MGSLKQRPAPPEPGLTFRVGVSGHLWSKMPGAEPAVLTEQVRDVLIQIRETVYTFIQEKRAPYSPDQSPTLILLTALADGADQLVAQEALDAGYQLHVILPFDRATVESTEFVGLDESREQFAKLLARCSAVLELDGTADAGAEASNLAYQQAGRMVLRYSDLLLTIWNGAPPLGPGGTGEIVQIAIEDDIPVVWIKSAPDHGAGLLRSASLSAPTSDSLSLLPERLDRLLALPSHQPSAKEHADGRVQPAAAARDYFHEPHQAAGILTRLWEIVIRTVAGGPLRRLDPFPDDYVAATRAGWLRTWRAQAKLPEPYCTWLLARLEESGVLAHYAWADNLATYYGLRFRSGFTASYMLAPVAVFFATFGFVAESWAVRAAVGESMALGSIFWIYWRATHGRLRERWLDYRSLAERLRYLVFLLPIGRPTIAFRIAAHNRMADPRDTWTNWLFRALVRRAGVFTARMDGAHLEACRTLLSNAELKSQLDYHQRNQDRMHRVHRRLHSCANVFFFFALLFAVAHGVAHVLAPKLFEAATAPFYDWAHSGSNHLAVARVQGGLRLAGLFAGVVLPAAGAAIHGFLSQGDFEGSERRSFGIAEGLRDLLQQLDAVPGHGAHPRAESLGSLAETAALTMADEMVDWRVQFLAKHDTLV